MTRRTHCSPRSTVSESYAPTKRANKVADWIEVAALGKSASLGGAALQEAGSQHGYKETDISLGINTINRRATLLGGSYPFLTASGGVAAKHDAHEQVWTALLLMSAESPIRTVKLVAEAAEHLERITAAALTNLYGPGTEAIRFGWPSDCGRPPEFPDAVRWLAKRMGVPVGAAYRSMSWRGERSPTEGQGSQCCLLSAPLNVSTHTRQPTSTWRSGRAGWRWTPIPPPPWLWPMSSPQVRNGTPWPPAQSSSIGFDWLRLLDTRVVTHY